MTHWHLAVELDEVKGSLRTCTRAVTFMYVVWLWNSLVWTGPHLYSTELGLRGVCLGICLKNEVGLQAKSGPCRGRVHSTPILSVHALLNVSHAAPGSSWLQQSAESYEKPNLYNHQMSKSMFECDCKELPVHRPHTFCNNDRSFKANCTGNMWCPLQKIIARWLILLGVHDFQNSVMCTWSSYVPFKNVTL